MPSQRNFYIPLKSLNHGYDTARQRVTKKHICPNRWLPCHGSTPKVLLLSKPINKHIRDKHCGKGKKDVLGDGISDNEQMVYQTLSP